MAWRRGRRSLGDHRPVQVAATVADDRARLAALDVAAALRVLAREPARPRRLQRLHARPPDALLPPDERGPLPHRPLSSGRPRSGSTRSPTTRCSCPASKIGGPLQRVFSPAFSRIQDEPERIAAAWARVMRLIGGDLRPGAGGPRRRGPRLRAGRARAQWRPPSRWSRSSPGSGSSRRSRASTSTSSWRATARARCSASRSCSAPLPPVAFAVGAPVGRHRRRRGVRDLHDARGDLPDRARRRALLGVSPMVFCASLRASFQAASACARAYSPSAWRSGRRRGPGCAPRHLHRSGRAGLTPLCLWRVPELAEEARALLGRRGVQAPAEAVMAGRKPNRTLVAGTGPAAKDGAMKQPLRAAGPSPAIADPPDGSIAIVVLTHNRVHLLQKCVENVLSRTSEAREIVIWDNASTDGTAEYLGSLKISRPHDHERQEHRSERLRPRVQANDVPAHGRVRRRRRGRAVELGSAMREASCDSRTWASSQRTWRTTRTTRRRAPAPRAPALVHPGRHQRRQAPARPDRRRLCDDLQGV